MHVSLPRTCPCGACRCRACAHHCRARARTATAAAHAVRAWHLRLPLTFSRCACVGRYVHGFDHFCEFVGNDIGKGNLSCFVTFLVRSLHTSLGRPPLLTSLGDTWQVLLSLLSTYVVVLSCWLVTTFFLPPDPEWHLLLVPWRLCVAGVVAALLGCSLYKCATSEVCAHHRGPTWSFSCLLVPSHAFSRLLTPSHAFSRLLTSSHAFSRLLTSSHAFSHSLTPAHTPSVTPSHALSRLLARPLTPSRTPSLPPSRRCARACCR